MSDSNLWKGGLTMSRPLKCWFCSNYVESFCTGSMRCEAGMSREAGCMVSYFEFSGVVSLLRKIFGVITKR